MKNVAQFKKRLVVGQKLHCIRFSTVGFNGVQIPDTDLGIRPLSIVQSNSFALETTKENGEKSSSWCDIPKASQCEFVNENTIIIYWGEGTNRSKILQYTFVD